ncbi:MAG: exodeoxyribonuclease III [Acidobacteriota bacterium]
MRLVTWNVNSVRARLPRLLAFLERRCPDVVCLQETKVVDADFPAAEIEAAGYRCQVFGQKTYNGVAILAREEPADVIRGLPDDPSDAQRRLIAATVGGVRVVCVYAPNGGEVDSDAYAFKLEWYRRLRAWLDAACDSGSELVLCGDLNVAPEDRDVWDPQRWRGQTLFSEPEKAALAAVTSWGLEDALRRLHPEGGVYTWWDYRFGAFHRGWGLRIDHIFATPLFAARCTAVEVDREERKGDKPSDHAPVIATFGPGEP